MTTILPHHDAAAPVAVSPMSAYRIGSAAQSVQFESSGELRMLNAELHESVGINNRQQPLILRAYGFAAACSCGIGSLAVVPLERHQALNRTLRASLERVGVHGYQTAQHQRQANGLLDSVLGVLRGRACLTGQLAS